MQDKAVAVLMLWSNVSEMLGIISCKCVCLVGRREASFNSAAVLILAQQRCKHVAVEEATLVVMYLLSNLCLSERPYILFRRWHLSSSTLWSGAGIWWGLEHAVLMDELVKAAPWCSAPHRTHGAGGTQSYGAESFETYLITHSKHQNIVFFGGGTCFTHEDWFKVYRGWWCQPRFLEFKKCKCIVRWQLPLVSWWAALSLYVRTTSFF